MMNGGCAEAVDGGLVIDVLQIMEPFAVPGSWWSFGGRTR